jgi:cobalamin synthase
VLRIMRDHAIGSYGAVALALVILLKVAAIAALIEQGRAAAYVILTPALGRWAAVLLSGAIRYARRSEGAIGNFVGRGELLIATATVVSLAVGLANWRGIAACALVAAVCVGWGAICQKRIGGVTGDTLGAGIEISETIVLLFGVAVP